jgi:hypothetical protein
MIASVSTETRMMNGLKKVRAPAITATISDREKCRAARNPTSAGTMLAAIEARSALKMDLPSTNIGRLIRISARGFQKSPA